MEGLMPVGSTNKCIFNFTCSVEVFWVCKGSDGFQEEFQVLIASLAKGC